MDMDLQVTLGNPGTIAGVISVNGRPLLDLATGSYANTGPQDASLMLMPLLRHPVSGAYRLTMVVDGEIEIDETYIQRSLVWDQPWPTIETTSFEPISFQNHLRWDFGSPSVDANDPGWRAAFPAGTYFPPEGPNQSRPYHGGSTASFTWDPDTLQISARVLAPGGKLRLAPAQEGLEYQSREHYLRAREAQTTFTYSVEGRAASYPSGGLVPVYIKALGGGEVPAKIRQLYVENARFDPDPTEPGAGSTFRANVVSFFFDEPQVSWQLTLSGPDPEDPETDGTTYLESNGDWQDFSESFDLSIPWNGLTEDGLEGPPGTYRATLILHVREKTKVNAQGGPIMLSTVTSALLTVGGDDQGEQFQIELYNEAGALIGSSEPKPQDPPFPSHEPIAILPPFEIADARFRGLSNNEFLELSRDKNGNLLPQKVDIQVIVGTSKPQPGDIFVKLSQSAPGGIRVPLEFAGTVAPDPERHDWYANAYRGVARIGPTSDPSAHQLKLQERTEDTFSSYDATSDGVYEGTYHHDLLNWRDSEAFIERETSLGNRELGRATKRNLNENGPGLSYPAGVVTSHTSLSSAGFETLLALDPRGRKHAWCRVPNQANTWYVSAHGWHDKGLLDGYAPGDVNWSRNVKLAIFAGCSVADIGNYNSIYNKDLSDNDFSSVGYGRKWHERLAPGGVLLGYNGSAPLAGVSDREPEDEEIVKAFYDRRAAFAGRDPERLAIAWLEANLSRPFWVGDGGVETSNACAVTDDYYYFIRVDFNQQRTQFARRQIYRVHRSHWKPEFFWREGFDKLRKTRGARVDLVQSSLNFPR